MKKIFNGGLELGILQIVGDEALSDKDKERKLYLESLPKNSWVALDENGMAISQEQAREQELDHLSRFKVKGEEN